VVRPEKRSGGRVTPRATTRPTTTAASSEPSGTRPSGVSRQPVKVSAGSPTWLPVVMFGLLGVGIVVILLNYLSVLPGAPTNWYLLAGLTAILGGIVAATQYR
jgi:hypothetical protein